MPRRELWLSFLIVALGCLFLFPEVFLRGYVQLPADIRYGHDPVYRESAPPGFERENNSLLSDHVYVTHALQTAAARRLQSAAGAPLWNPYIFAGTPLLADSLAAPYYPPSWLLWFTSAEVAATVRGLFNILVAGLGAYLVARRLGIGAWGAQLSSIAFAFGGIIMAGPAYQFIGVLAWLPWTLWAGENLILATAAGSRPPGRPYPLPPQNRLPERSERSAASAGEGAETLPVRRAPAARLPLIWACLLALTIGVGLTAGHAETTFHLLAVCGVYFLARLTFAPPEALWTDFPPGARRGSAALLVAAAALGIGLGAIQWLPLADFLRQSSIAGRAHLGGTPLYNPDWWRHALGLATVWAPNFYGNPQGFTYHWPFATFNNYLEQAVYFGAAPLALSVAALAAVRTGAPAAARRRTIFLLAALGLGCLLVAYRFPLFEAINYLPVFSLVNNNRFKWMFSFFGALLAGFGLDALAPAPDRLHSAGEPGVFRRDRSGGFSASAGESRPDRDTEGAGDASMDRTGRLAAAASLCPLAGLALLAPFWALRWLALRSYINLPAPLLQWLKDVFTHHQPRTALSLFALGATAAILLARRFLPGRLRRRSWALGLPAALLGVTLIELLGLARGYNTTLPPELVKPDLPLVRFLKQDPELVRILPVAPAFWPNLGMLYALHDVSGFDLPVLREFADLYLAHGGRSNSYYQQWPADTPLADFLNVRYIITGAADPPQAPHLSEVYRGAGYAVYRNPNALPRACLIGAVDLVPDRAARIERLMSGAYDFSRGVILEQPLPPEQAAALAAADSAVPCRERPVRILSYQNERVIMQTAADGAALLVLSDAYASGWQAAVDGEPAPVYRANHAFRAVFVPAGEHNIEFNYRPRSFAIGRLISLIALFLTAAGLAWAAASLMVNFSIAWTRRH